ncbi:unnamed protein product [Rhodiola kirilowii]
MVGDSHDAFAKSLGALLSVVVQDLQIKLKLDINGPAITAVYCNNFRPAFLGSDSIQLGNLYAEEEQELLVEIRLEIGEEVRFVRVKLDAFNFIHVVHESGKTKSRVLSRRERKENVRPLSPQFLPTRIPPDRRATVFSISNTRRWRMTTPGSVRLYVKASDGQVNPTDSETENHTETNNSSGGGKGVIGSALAAVVLAAGVAFAVVIIKKRTAMRLQKEMEISTPHQEELLVIDIEEKGDEDDNKQSTGLIDDTDRLQNITGTSDGISPSLKVIDNRKELQFVDADHDDEVHGSRTVHEFSYSVIESEAIDNAHIQDVPEDRPALGDLPLAPDVNLESDHMIGEGILDNSVISSHVKESDSGPFSNTSEPNSGKAEDFNAVDPSNELSIESYTTRLDIDEPTENINVDNQTNSEVLSEAETHTAQDLHDVENDGVELGSSAMLIDDSNVLQTNRDTVDENYSILGTHELDENDPSAMKSVETSLTSEHVNGDREQYNSNLFIDRNPVFSGVPAPSVVSPALQVPLGKIVVPAFVDQVQSQAFTALQVLKIIEADAQPGNLCTRREFARWLVSASSVLSRSTISKVYPAMYIENVTELAFDDVTPEDPDFPSIQGLAEAGLIASKLSRGDMLSSGEDEGPLVFSPESLLSREALVSWKIALQTRNLPEADRKTLYQASGFVDIDRINPAVWPALVADLTSGDQAIVPLAFGYTRLFQPAKPVTKAQAAIALAIGESSDVVNEELARIEAESMAENAVAAHSELVAQVEKDLNDSFEKKLLYEREMISAVEKMAEEAKQELEKIRHQREEDQLSLTKEKAAAELEMEVLSKLKREVDAQLYDILSNKVEISYEKERIVALRKEVEAENQEIVRLQYELEIERKALSMARTWAEDEAKKAREQAKALEEARERWERQGLRIVVDDDLRQDAVGDSTWVNAGNTVSVKDTSSRAEILVGKLKTMADNVSGRTRIIITMIIEKIVKLISALKEKASNIGKQSEELKEVTILKARETTKVLQRSTAEFTYNVTEAAKGVAKDCKGGVENLTQRFKKWDKSS